MTPDFWFCPTHSNVQPQNIVALIVAVWKVRVSFQQQQKKECKSPTDGFLSRCDAALGHRNKKTSSTILYKCNAIGSGAWRVLQRWKGFNVRSPNAHHLHGFTQFCPNIYLVRFSLAQTCKAMAAARGHTDTDKTKKQQKKTIHETKNTDIRYSVNCFGPIELHFRSVWLRSVAASLRLFNAARRCRAWRRSRVRITHENDEILRTAHPPRRIDAIPI